MQGSLRAKHYPGEPRNLHQNPDSVAQKIVALLAANQSEPTGKTIEILL